MQDAPLPWRLRDETLPGSDGSGAVCRSVSSKSKQAVKPCLLISPDLLEVFCIFFSNCSLRITGFSVRVWEVSLLLSEIIVI